MKGLLWTEIVTKQRIFKENLFNFLEGDNPFSKNI